LQPGAPGKQPGCHQRADHGQCDQRAPAQLEELLAHLDGDNGEQPRHQAQVHGPASLPAEQPDRQFGSQGRRCRQERDAGQQQQDVAAAGPMEDEELGATPGDVEHRLGDGETAQDEELEEDTKLGPQPRDQPRQAGHTRTVSLVRDPRGHASHNRPSQRGCQSSFSSVIT
jgi:hypothetical protein